MHKEQIQVIRPKIFQRLIQTLFHILRGMLSIPQLARDEDVGPGHTAAANTLSNFGLVTVDGSAVNMLITALESNLNGLFNLAGRSLPCPEAYSWDLSSSIERKVC